MSVRSSGTSTSTLKFWQLPVSLPIRTYDDKTTLTTVPAGTPVAVLDTGNHNILDPDDVVLVQPRDGALGAEQFAASRTGLESLLSSNLPSPSWTGRTEWDGPALAAMGYVALRVTTGPDGNMALSLGHPNRGNELSSWLYANGTGKGWNLHKLALTGDGQSWVATASHENTSS